MTGGNFQEGDIVINNRANYGNPVSVFHGGAANRFKDASAMILGNKQQIIDFAEAEIAVRHPRFYFLAMLLLTPGADILMHIV